MKFKKHYIGIALIVVGVILFIAFTEKKSRYRIYQEKRTSNNNVYKDNLEVKGGTNYLITFSAENEAGGGFDEWPRVAASIEIVDNNKKQLFSAKIDYTEHRETGGLRRAQDYREFKYKALKDEKLLIETNLIEGDKMELSIYENISDLGNILPGLGIILALIGVFVFFKFKNQKT